MKWKPISLAEINANSHPYEHEIGDVENISPYATTAVAATFMGLGPTNLPLRPMQQINEGESLLDSLVGAHSHVLDISC